MAGSLQKILKPTKYRATDTSGNNNHGQIYSGRGLEFDGVGDRFATTGGGTFDVPSTTVPGVNSFADGEPWTLAVWMYLNGRQDCYVIGKDQGTRPHIFLNSDSNIQYIEFRSEDTGNDFYRFGRFQENTWHRLVITCNGTTISAYSNGALIGTITDGMASTDSSGSFSSTEAWFTGWGVAYESSENYGTALDGMMSDGQVWNVEWSASDVTFDYLNPESLALNNGGTSLTESNLKLWYPMQDGHRGQQSYVLDGANTGLGDEMVTNQDFESNITDGSWTGKDSTISHETTSPISGSGSIKVSSLANASAGPFQNIGMVEGVTYKVKGTLQLLTGSSNGTVKVINSNAAGGSQDILYSGTSGELVSGGAAVSFTVYITALSSQPSIQFGCNVADGSFLLDDVSVKPINDKHHATTVFYGDELITVTKDKNMDASNNWTVSSANWSIDGNSLDYDGSGGGSSALDETYPAFVVGRTYRLQFNTSANDTIITIKDGDGSNTFVAEATYTSGTKTVTFVAPATTDGLELTAGGSSAAFAIDWINVKEEGTATGWTNADQQLDIPQTALQSYNQLAWFGGGNEENGTLDSVINTGSTDWSLSFWLYHDDAGSGTVFILGYDGTRNISITEEYNLLQFREVTSATYYTLSANNAIKEGEWNHIVITTDGATSMTAYINGEAQTTNTSMSSTEINVTKIMHGYNDTQGFAARGCMTEIAYFANTQLTQAQVNTLFNDGKAYDVELDSTLWAATTGYWKNNGLAEWEDKKGTNDINTENVIETLLLPAGVDASRDNQGFLMNRQKDTNSANFSEALDYVTVGDNSTFDFGASTDFSVSFWAKYTSDGYMGFVSKGVGGVDGGWEVMVGNGTGKLFGRIEPTGGTRAEVASGSEYSDGEWHHFVVVYARSALMTLYIDKTADGTVDISGVGDIDAAHSLDIGQQTSGDNQFNGSIDDVLIYNKALSSPEVTRIYNAGKRSHR